MLQCAAGPLVKRRYVSSSMWWSRWMRCVGKYDWGISQAREDGVRRKVIEHTALTVCLGWSLGRLTSSISPLDPLWIL